MPQVGKAMAAASHRKHKTPAFKMMWFEIVPSTVEVRYSGLNLVINSYFTVKNPFFSSVLFMGTIE